MEHRILVTGATGFIGRYVIKELLNKKDIRILALCRRKSDFYDNRVICFPVDFPHMENLSKTLHDFEPTGVIHLAAISSPTHSNVGEIYDVNVHGTENLLTCLRSLKRDIRVVLASTAGVYGVCKKEYIDEETEFNPQNHYSFSKMVMEYITRSYLNDLDIKIIRPFNVIGMGQKEFFLIPKLVSTFVRRQKVLEIGNLETIRDYIDVEYAAKIFCTLLFNKEFNYNVLNLCSGVGIKGWDIVKILENLTGFSPTFHVNSDFVRNNEIIRLVGDPSRCNGICNKEFQNLNIREVLLKMILAYDRVQKYTTEHNNT